MNRNTLITTVIIVALAVVGIILFTSESRTQTNGPQTNEPAQSTTTTDEGGSQDRRRITAKYQYESEDGLHILAGEVEVPTPCHQLATSVDGTATSSSVTVNFTAERDDSKQVCAQVITPRRFKVTFEAQESVDMNATYNGEDATLNRVPVGEDENLEEFKVFQKG